MNGIQLIIEPGKVVSWKDFKRKAPIRSIAIDGYVDHPTVFDEIKIIHNFDHHKGVNRLATRATCDQVRKAILQGLLDCYRDENGELSFTIYANDCDEDVCLSYFLLHNPEWACKVSDPLLNKLLFFEDMLDTTAGTYPFSKDSSFLRELEWIFMPYKKARIGGILEKNNPQDYFDIIKSVERNILHYLVGKGDKVDYFNTSYEVIGGGKGWSMVKEIGEQARKGMISDGIKKFISVRERPDGKWTYVIGKMTPYSLGFNLTDWFPRLNEIEGCKEGGWGGSDTIGGSPRGIGSSIPPEQLQMHINTWIAE
ncbi:hypothetical protein ACFVS2_20780 [Brevibacillus sp. NPDC058079]|uniref:hypothetical protein n=1 Tax=Brevibacillus sp. NPDC058079 TaxID=3346330 RepID=UPI0036E98C47